MHVNQDHSVDSYCLEQPGNIGGRDGYPWCGFPVLPGVSVVGDDDVDLLGTGPAHGGDHEEQFDQIFIDGGAGGLDDENVLRPDILVDLDADLPVVESAHFDAS